MRSNLGVVFCAVIAARFVVGSVGMPCLAEDLKAPRFDGFDGKLTLAWQPVREDKTHVSLAKHPGKLTITTQRGSIQGDEKHDRFGGGIQAKNLYLVGNPLPKGGDFVVTTCIESFQPTTLYQQAGLIVYDDDDNYLKWGMEASTATRSGRSFTSLQETDQLSQFDWIEAPAGLERFWLRMVKRGNRYQHAYSLDGKTFQVVGERAWGNGAPKFVGILAKNGGAPDAAEIDACFDFFELRGLNDVEKSHHSEVERLEGTWEVIQRSESGEVIQDAVPSQFGFAAGRATATEGSDSRQCDYFVDVAQEPKQLVFSMSSGGERKLLRIAYRLEVDRLVACFDPRPSAAAPNALETKPGDGRILLKARSLLARRFCGHTGPVYALAVSPDGKLAASGSGWPKGDQTIRLWELANGREVRKMSTLPLPYSPQEGAGDEIAGEVYSLAFSPDGRYVLSGGARGFVLLWEVAAGKLARRFQGHTGSVYCVAFSPDGRRAASASFDRTVRLWDVQTGKEVRRLEGHTNWVRAVAFSPDGRRILSGDADRTMRLWDAERGEPLRTFSNEHESWVWSVAFAPDGRQALSASETVRLWDIENGRVIRRLDGHFRDVNSAAFTPDGRRAVSGSWDSTVRVWDLESGKELQTFRGHRNWVWRIAVTPDGRFALSGGGGDQSAEGFAPGDDFAVRLWKLP